MATTIQETANGHAVTFKGDYVSPVTIMFPFGIAPSLVFGDSLVKIVRPERFGTWQTFAEMKAFTRQFAVWGEERPE